MTLAASDSTTRPIDQAIMSAPASVLNEPLTPTGRIYLQKKINQVILGAVGVRDPIDVDRLRLTLPHSPMVNHPRFSSLVSRGIRGEDRWKGSLVNVDDHVIVLENPVSADHDDEAAVNEYLAGLSDTCSDWPVSDRPLWEMHILVAHRCLVFRIHHSLGDGTSLIALLLASCTREASIPLEELGPRVTAERRTISKPNGWKDGAVRTMSDIWQRAAYIMELMARTTFLKDSRTIISGGNGVEMLPRKVATARFSMEDMHIVKFSEAGATINDVLCTIISIGLFRYIKQRSPGDLKQGTKMTGIVVANVREKRGLLELPEMLGGCPGTRWGNKVGYIFLPLDYRVNDFHDQLGCLRRIKATLDGKKAWSEASFSSKLFESAVSYAGPKAVSIVKHRICCNTTFVISNIFGPMEELAVMGNPITYIRMTSTGLPHALFMHMVSYAGRADMQVLAAKHIIPDPEFLAYCFEEALVGLKQAAMETPSISSSQ
ncbi:hypothetical protein MLD38_009236 [Melastoma candidum]|uniref:Uncharacterized protein n=1 Tax=Melastoma candidum TaxID=119954 RepID=A0ACB9RX40_9MYRT|nr:hypothetical protein MLD38_009236 [Melastoma candidum]